VTPALFMIHVFERLSWREIPVPRTKLDYTQCQALLCAVPEYRYRLAELSAVSPKWARVVAIWPQLERGQVEVLLNQWDREDRIAQAVAVGDDRTERRLEECD